MQGLEEVAKELDEAAARIEVGPEEGAHDQPVPGASPSQEVAGATSTTSDPPRPLSPAEVVELAKAAVSRAGEDESRGRVGTPVLVALITAVATVVGVGLSHVLEREPPVDCVPYVALLADLRQQFPDADYGEMFDAEGLRFPREEDCGSPSSFFDSIGEGTADGSDAGPAAGG